MLAISFWMALCRISYEGGERQPHMGIAWPFVHRNRKGEATLRGRGSRRAYWKQQAHQISRNIEMKWLTTFYDCIWELRNRVEFSGQSRVLKLWCEFFWGDTNKYLFVPGGTWMTEQRRSCSCSCVVNQWIYWACFCEGMWPKDSLMDEEVHLTMSDDSWKLYPL